MKLSTILDPTLRGLSLCSVLVLGTFGLAAALGRMTGMHLIDACFNGLSLSSILILTALGLSITFGVMGVINMAHGDMLMLGAYTAYVVTNENYLGLNLYWAIPISFLVVGFVGYLMEVALIRFLYGRPLDTLLATWGVGLILQQAVSLAFGPDLKPMDLPVELRPSWEFQVSEGWYRLICIALPALCLATLALWVLRSPAGTRLRGLVLRRNGPAAGGPVHRLDTLLVTVVLLVAAGAGGLFGQHFLTTTELGAGNIEFPYYRMFIVGITSLCLLGVYLWFYWTSFGLKMRAVTQNRAMASALGINTRRVDALTFALGTGLAGVAGCIFGHLYVVNADMGNEYIVDAFMVVILGGMGSLAGTILGGAILGTGKSILTKFFGTSVLEQLSRFDSQMARVAVLLVVIAFVLARPAGLFATRERVYD